MARTLVMIANNPRGVTDDHASRLAHLNYQYLQEGKRSMLDKEDLEEKNKPVSWLIENLCRAFREVFTNLKWNKVFESLDVHSISSEEDTDQYCIRSFHAFQVFWKLFSGCKPKNLAFNFDFLINREWRNRRAQFSLLRFAIEMQYKEPGTFRFKDIGPRAEYEETGEPSDLGKGEPSPQTLDEIWCCRDLV